MDPRTAPQEWLRGLPEELQLRIARYITSSKDLSSLCLSSVTFNRITQPVLFDSCDIGCENLRLFLLTVLRRPYLAQKVKSLTLQLPEEDEHLSQSCTPWSLDEAVKKYGYIYRKNWPPERLDCLYSKAVNKWPIGDYCKIKWMKCLEDGKATAEVALLLASLPKLESLHLGISELHYVRGDILGYFLHRSVGSHRPLLSVLKNLSLFYTGDEGNFLRDFPYWLPDLESLMSLPSLKSLSTRSVPLFGLIHYPSQSLEELNLLSSYTNAKVVMELLRNCSNVRLLRCDFGYYAWNTSVPSIGPWFTNVCQALSAHASTLETMILRPCSLSIGRSTLQLGDEAIPITLPNLHDFTKLKSIDLPQFALLGHGLPHNEFEHQPKIASMLLATLTDIRLQYCDPGIIPHVRQVFDRWRAFPELTRITVHFADPNPHRDRSADVIRDLAALAVDFARDTPIRFKIPCTYMSTSC